MTLCTIGTRSVISVAPDTKVADVARMMSERSLGSVVIARGETPVGIITDRDLVVRVMVQGLDPSAVSVEEVMSAPLTTVPQKAEALQAAALMREAQVRRLPVVSEEGALVGIVCLDDLTHHLSRCYHEISEAISNWPVPYEGG